MVWKRKMTGSIGKINKTGSVWGRESDRGPRQVGTKAGKASAHDHDLDTTTTITTTTTATPTTTVTTTA
jgi:hypothetical protein